MIGEKGKCQGEKKREKDLQQEMITGQGVENRKRRKRKKRIN